MAEYIEREAAIESLPVAWDSAINALRNATSADVSPVVHGRWINPPLWGIGVCACSRCKDKSVIFVFSNGEISEKFCPLCGAKMDGDSDAEED